MPRVVRMLQTTGVGRTIASPEAVDAMLAHGEPRIGYRTRACGWCRSWLVVEVTYPEAKHALAVLALAALCFVLDQTGTAVMLLVLGAILGSCFADRLGFIRVLVGLAVLVGGAWYGYERCGPYLCPEDRIASAVTLPFVLATLTGTPRIPGESWRRWTSSSRFGPSFPLFLGGGAALTVAAALGYAKGRDPADAFQWAFCAVVLLVFHIICNAFRDTAHSVAFPEPQPTATSRSPPRQAAAWQAAAAKLPRNAVHEENLQGSTLSSPHVPRCTVCIEEFRVGEIRLTLPCFHGFHPECVESWIQENGRCPVCRHSILENDASDVNTSTAFR